MKLNLQILGIYITILFSINVNGQSNIKKVAYSAYENKMDLHSKYKGNIVVLSIINHEYLGEIEKLNKLANRYKNENVEFIVITDHNNVNLNTSIIKQFSNYRQLSKKENKKIFNSYQKGMYKVFPIQIIIDTKGELKYKRQGERINALLKKNTYETKDQSYIYTIN